MLKMAWVTFLNSRPTSRRAFENLRQAFELAESTFNDSLADQVRKRMEECEKLCERARQRRKKAAAIAQEVCVCVCSYTYSCILFVRH